MGLVVKCPDCGLKMAAEKLQRHRPGGVCLDRLNKSVKGSPSTKVVSGSELADRSFEEFGR